MGERILRRVEDLEWVGMGGGGCNGGGRDGEYGMEERRNGGGGMESMVCYQTVRYGER